MATYAKCPYCGKQFDRDKEPYVKIGRRYLHKACCEAQDPKLIQEQIDEDLFFRYIRTIYGPDYNYVLMKKQLDTFRNQGYTLNGIRHSIKYFYEVKHNSPEDAEGIGIVPYIYEEAKKYYYNIYLAQQENEKFKNYKAAERRITIASPKRRIATPPFWNI